MHNITNFVNNNFGDKMKTMLCILGGAVLALTALELADSQKMKNVVNKLMKNKMN